VTPTAGVSAAFAPIRGTRVAGFVVCARVHSGQCSVVYQGRRADGLLAALKVSTADEAERLEREASVLCRLSGCASPEVLARGVVGSDSFLALTWRPGIDSRRAASELRAGAARSDLLGMCLTIVRAYVEIHKRGVLHGHVHPRNVLIDGNGLVSVLDFGSGPTQLSTLAAPAQAKSWLRGEGSGCADAQDEQYSLAALVYLLITGRIPFRADRQMSIVASQILTMPMLAFAEQDAPEWP
jgi:serine/threonine protein kinase